MDKNLPSSRRERVLVVDDSREIREFLIEYILEPAGFEVIVAADGLEGLQLAFSERPDLLIVDFQMPNMSGLELLRRLRLRQVDIPSILVTAHGSEQVAIQALRLGVRDYVIKPFVVEEMKEAIERALRESRLSQEREQLIDQLRATNKRLKQNAQELNALYSIGKSVSSTLDLEAILQRVVEAAVYLTGTDQGSLMLLDERGDLYVRASKSKDGVVKSLNERIQDNEAGRVLREKHTSILKGETLPLHVPTAAKAHTLAYVPLLTQGNAIGVLAVANHQKERPLTQRETRVLSALGSYAAVAISNARLHQGISAQRNQLHTIINQSDNPILVVDHNHCLLVANQAARNILSMPSGNLDGRLISDVVHNAELVAFITQLPDTGLVRNTRIRLSTGRTYRATLTPIRDIGRSVVMQEDPVIG